MGECKGEGRGRGTGPVWARLLADGDREMSTGFLFTTSPVRLCLSVLGINQTREHEYPRFVCRQVDIEIVVKSVEKFLFHLVDFGQGNARDVGPGFVSVCVVVKELVGKHQGGDRETVLAPSTPFYGRVGAFEGVDVVEGEGDDRLADLGGREQISNKRHKLWPGRELHVVVGRVGALAPAEPEVANHVAHILGDGAEGLRAAGLGLWRG